MPDIAQVITATETIELPEMDLDGWVFERDDCYFDLAIGFAAEWKATGEPFVVLDLETTSPRSESGEVLEFAAILVDASGAVATEFSMLVSITEPVPGFIRKETGITQAEVDREGRPLAEAMKAFLDFIGSRPVFIHDALFAKAVLKKAGEQTQQTFANPVYDTLTIAILTWSPLSCDSIDVLAEHVGAPKTGQRAIDYAKATLAVLLAARQQARLEPASTQCSDARRQVHDLFC